MPEPSTTGWGRLDRDLVEVTGPESGTYLQGQLSQDVLALGPGDHSWSWVLAPNGKVDALVRVVRLGPERWLLDTDGGGGAALLARLARFKLRTKAELAPFDATVVARRGARPDPADLAGPVLAVLDPPWPGMTGADVVVEGHDVDLPGPALTADEVEAGRIRAGVPRLGAELSDRTIPAETGLVEATVSFTKGCYTGQELVARVDSRGNHVPRFLRAVELAGPAEPGTELVDGDAAAGTITSVAADGPGRWVALAYLKRGNEAPRALTAGPDGPAATIL